MRWQDASSSTRCTPQYLLSFDPKAIAQKLFVSPYESVRRQYWPCLLHRTFHAVKFRWLWLHMVHIMYRISTEHQRRSAGAACIKNISLDRQLGATLFERHANTCHT